MDRDSDIGGYVVAKNKGVDPECNKEKLVRCGAFTQDCWSVEIADGIMEMLEGRCARIAERLANSATKVDVRRTMMVRGGGYLRSGD